MTPAEILAITSTEQVRAMAMIAGLDSCPIRLSRATSELGSFSIDRTDDSMEISVSRYIATDDQVRETIRHELAHQAAWERYRDLGHGPLWQTFATYLDCLPVACASYTVDPAIIAQRLRYEIRCESCGWAVRRQRRSKLVDRPWRFSCSRCSGKLLVTMLTPSDPSAP